eukprot:ANDGO_02302.mRNA.1 hypothetical protein
MAKARNGPRKEKISSAAQTVFSLNGKLFDLKLKVRDVVGDGNCLFRSISFWYCGSENMHEEVRQRVCEFMNLQQDWFSLFVENDETWVSYICRMEKEGTWGGNLELVAASRLYKVHIVVHQTSGPALSIECEPSSAATGTWHFVYLEDEHYACAVPISENDLPPSLSVPPKADADPEQTRQKVKIVLESIPNTATATPDTVLAVLYRLGYDLDKTIDYFIDEYANEPPIEDQAEAGGHPICSKSVDDNEKTRDDEPHEEDQAQKGRMSRSRKLSKYEKKRLRDETKRAERQKAKTNAEHSAQPPSSSFSALKI